MWRSGLSSLFLGILLTVSGVSGVLAAAPVEELCSVEEPPRVQRLPRTAEQEILITSRKLAWVGNQLLQKGRLEEASLHLRDAFNVLQTLEVPPPLDMARVANALGFAYTLLEAYTDARPAYELALDYLPVDQPEFAAQRPAVLLNYVEMLFRIGEWKRARDFLHEALELQELTDVPAADRVPAYISRGELELSSGKPAEAEKWLRKALDIMATDEAALPRHRYAVMTALQESYSLQGREEEAGRVGRQMLDLQVQIRTAEE